MEWLTDFFKSDAFGAILGTCVTALSGTGIALLVSWMKNLKIIKKLKLEAMIDHAGEVAINYAEAWGRKESKKGLEKLNAAKEAFEGELKRQGIKLDAGDMEKRLEALFNKLKPYVEKATKDK